MRVLQRIAPPARAVDYTTAGDGVFKHLREEIDGIMARDPGRGAPSGRLDPMTAPPARVAALEAGQPPSTKTVITRSGGILEAQGDTR